jgi:hypothetical protein
MDLIVEPDTYEPSIDTNGKYIDKITIFRNGLRCPCGAGSHKVPKTYETLDSFKCHTKTKGHQIWIANMNTNKQNYYVECVKLEETVRQQKVLIGQLERDVNNRSKMNDILVEKIEELKEQLLKPNTNTFDLLNMD